MTWPRPRALLLDAMGTLIGLRTSVGSTYAAGAAAHGLRLDPEALDRVLPAILRQAPPLAFPGLRGEALHRAEEEWWGERISESFRAAGGDPAPAALRRELFLHYADPSAWKVYADVPAALRRWQEKGIRLAVVSNFDSRLHDLLAGLDLSDRFEVVVVSSSAGSAKPAATPFRLALEHLDLAPEEAWHVGDSEEDVRGAAAAGIRCLRVRRR